MTSHKAYAFTNVQRIYARNRNGGKSYSSGSPEYRAIASRAWSRSRTISAK